MLLRIRHVADKSSREIKTRVLCSITVFFFENRAVYEIMWKKIVEPDRPSMTIWRMRIERWIPKATNTHSEYVVLIAFPLQQWLHERDIRTVYCLSGRVLGVASCSFQQQ